MRKNKNPRSDCVGTLSPKEQIVFDTIIKIVCSACGRADKESCELYKTRCYSMYAEEARQVIQALCLNS